MTSINTDTVHDHDSLSVKDASTATARTSIYAASSSTVEVSERATVRRVDWRMLPLLGFLYSVTIIDRSNMGIARTAGMGDQLGLDKGNRFSVVSCVYFIPYILLQLPTNLVLRKFGARNCLTFYIFGWGCVEIGMGFCKSWKTLAWCRVLLGAFEAGFFPALIYIVSTWYTRQEVQTRIAGFLQGSIAISGFGAVLSYVLTLMDGIGGYRGWSWIFIIEGIATVGCSFLSFFFVPDFPDKNNFLTKEQTKIILRRVEDDRGDSVPDGITHSKIVHHLKDWVLWAHGFMYMASTMPAYAASFFSPIILFGMGWSVSETLLLSAPPLVAAALSAFIFAWVSDRSGQRGIFIAIQSCMTITGMLITGYAAGNGVRYFGIFVFSAGASGCMSSIIAYNANNIAGQSKRSISSALLVSFGGIGGILGTTVFRQADYPRYIPGMWAIIGAQILMLSLLTVTTITYSALNKRARKTGEPLEGQVGFFYIL